MPELTPDQMLAALRERYEELCILQVPDAGTGWGWEISGYNPADTRYYTIMVTGNDVLRDEAVRFAHRALIGPTAPDPKPTDDAALPDPCPTCMGPGVVARIVIGDHGERMIAEYACPECAPEPAGSEEGR